MHKHYTIDDIVQAATAGASTIVEHVVVPVIDLLGDLGTEQRTVNQQDLAKLREIGTDGAAASAKALVERIGQLGTVVDSDAAIEEIIAKAVKDHETSLRQAVDVIHIETKQLQGE